ncbi:MAG: monofunctional biosynthetic peptidoglycan transglycosylase [Hyphomicrobiaceae bacterium]
MTVGSDLKEDGVARRRGAARPRAGLGRIIVGCAGLALLHGSKWLVLAVLVGVGLFGFLLGLLRVADPPGSALMAQRYLAGTGIEQQWVAIERISPHLVNAVVMSEDARFCAHGGIDFRELERAIDRAAERGERSVRGASTISMQVVKNMFLWNDRSLVRKGLEMAMTPMMEVVLPKRRILEIYLNIAEWGPGVFGAEAAARYHFDKSASRLTAREAALLAVTLPNPFERIAGEPGRGLRRLADTIQARMRSAGAYTQCVKG